MADLGQERRTLPGDDRLDEIRAAAFARPRHEIVARGGEVAVVVVDVDELATGPVRVIDQRGQRLDDRLDFGGVASSCS